MKSEVRPLWVLGKALLLFLVVNIVFAWINPSLGAVSAYNVILPGRVRFPFGGGEDPYFVMVDNLDVMTASHVISSPKAEDEYDKPKNNLPLQLTSFIGRGEEIVLLYRGAQRYGLVGSCL